MNRLKIYVITGLLIGLVILILYPGRQMARDHVNERTAVTDHPLLCTSCHVPLSKNKSLLTPGLMPERLCCMMVESSA